MRMLIPLQALSTTAVIALLVGCSGGSAVAPKPASPQAGSPFLLGRVPSVHDAIGQLNIITRTGHHFASYYSCPVTGPIKYVSDEIFNNISVYVGKFAGQGPCGLITSGLASPWGLYVKNATHDLYVANHGGHNVVVFHRGKMTPYNTYTDPSVQTPMDVTVAKDGTVIASNGGEVWGPGSSSISTWIGGPNGGTFVGNFPMTNAEFGGFITVKKNGTVYYNDLDLTTGNGALWKLSCPAGACGAQTQVTGVSLFPPYGMAIDVNEDLLANDRNGGTADTFELPNPIPSTFPLAGGPFAMAIDKLDHHWFITNISPPVDAAEYLYPSGKLVGTVPVNHGSGVPIGIAIDP